MRIEEILSRPITGIEPFNELPIDDNIWREAHLRHFFHRTLDARVLHRPGIAFGLEVVVDPQSKGKALIVAPGLAVDPEGNSVVLSEPTRLHIHREDTKLFVTLGYTEELDAASSITVGGGKKHFRIREGRSLTVDGDPPKAPNFELARILRSSGSAPVRAASNPYDPGEDELNLLHRISAFPKCAADIQVAELSFVPVSDPDAWKPNRAGLCLLIRQANTMGLHVEYTGLFNLRQPSSDPTLLYASTFGAFRPLGPDQLEGLSKFLSKGGTLFAEASQGSPEFEAGFREMASRLGANLQPLHAAHPLLNSMFVFASAPNGAASEGGVWADLEAGLIFSSADYGGAWQGTYSTARPIIRDATEFGLNVLVFANERRRRTYVGALRP
jgi:hypothetical protein